MTFGSIMIVHQVCQSLAVLCAAEVSKTFLSFSALVLRGDIARLRRCTAIMTVSTTCIVNFCIVTVVLCKLLIFELTSYIELHVKCKNKVLTL